MKVDLELIKATLLEHGVDDQTLFSVVKDLQKKAEEEADKGDKPKDGKYQFVLVVYDPEGELKDKEFTGFAAKIPEENSVYSVTEGIIRAGYEFNTTKKGRRLPVKTIGEIMETVPDKLLKEFGVKRLHREPVFLVTTDGLLPTETTDRQVDKRRGL